MGCEAHPSQAMGFVLLLDCHAKLQVISLSTLFVPIQQNRYYLEKATP